MSNSPSKGTALIAGASRGVGAIYADRLAKRGYDLIRVARNESQLKELAARLKRETARSVTPLPADLNGNADLQKVERELRDYPSISMLVNNAGLGSVAPLLKADIDQMDHITAAACSNVTLTTTHHLASVMHR